MMNNKKTRKSYAYGSMVRKPMQMGGTAMSANPMMPRTQQGIQPAMGMPKMAGGGKLKMVKNKAGDMVPFYAADGEGKMAYGGKMKPKRNG
jgi:hypothetical protein